MECICRQIPQIFDLRCVFVGGDSRCCSELIPFRLIIDENAFLVLFCPFFQFLQFA